MPNFQYRWYVKKMNLALFQKPSRYIGGELNSLGSPRSVFPGKSSGHGVVRMALSFPDVYEVGMSHLGFRILYEIINSLPHASAERVFSPWTDLEEHMKREGILLSSLESQTPLREFDLVGFSLQYELSYTTVLNMLDLGGIPVRSAERLNSREDYPLVVAGGPCTVNPAPMAPFIDVFLIGDGEEAVVELIDSVGRSKLNGAQRRESILRAISEREGFYVPSVPRSGPRVRRRFLMSLDEAPYPVRPVVPFAPIVHDRVTIEVSRGCTRGCRFCQAGMIYRPLRERSPEKVLALAEESLKHTGYDEVSFASLSAGDYTHLLPVVREFNRRFAGSRTAISLPSLRVGALSKDVLTEIRSVRKTGFTMAPEAATERLRGVINKDFSEEEYERALRMLFEEGWLNLKLYFMIGLPTERDEDIEAISSVAMKALRIAKKNTGRFVNIGITISPFVPKPHTPFQWCGQINLGEMKRKGGYLREALSRSKFKYKGHNEEMSLLEAVFARGDEGLSGLIEKAWQRGCRLDGWSEIFDFKKWCDAMDRTGIDASSYAERRFDVNEPLPWDKIDIGISKDFFLSEYERAIKGEMTPDCAEVCISCGLKCASEEPVVLGRQSSVFDGESSASGPRLCIESRQSGVESQQKEEVAPRPLSLAPKQRVRVQFSKEGRLRYLSHLEVVTAFLRALRRAGVPVDFSKGFHPSPRVSSGPALGVGVAGEKEYFDMEILGPFDTEFFMKTLNATLPEGIRIGRMAAVSMAEPSLNAFIKRYRYRIKGKTLRVPADEAGDTVPVVVKRDGVDIDLSPFIEDLAFLEGSGERGQGAIVTLRDRDPLKVRIGEIAEALFGESMKELTITRSALYGWKGSWVEPL